jgi:hypothetical protein
MKSILKSAVIGAILALGPMLPAVAQIDHSFVFTTTFSFYAANTKMPAGSYRISHTDFDANELLIQSTDEKYSAFVDFIQTEAEQPHQQTDVTFHKYGDVEYLNRIWVAGQTYGVKVNPTKSELKAASASAMVEHSITGN